MRALLTMGLVAALSGAVLAQAPAGAPAAAPASAPAAAPAPSRTPSAPRPAVTAGARDEVIALSRIRQASGSHMLMSKGVKIGRAHV